MFASASKQILIFICQAVEEDICVHKRKMSERSGERRINIRFCMTAAKKASETLALSRMTYGKFAMMKEVFLCRTNSSRIGKNI